MKRILTLLLVLALVLACAACGEKPAQPTDPQPEDGQPDVKVPQVTVDNPVTYFQMSICYEDGTYRSLTAYDDGQGMAYLEYVGEIKKVATLDPAVLHAVTAEMEKAGLEALNGVDVAEDGAMSASLYAAFADESYWGAGYTGTVSQEFLDGYGKLEAWFAELLTDVPEYVPQPMVMGEVDEGILAEMLNVLNQSGLDPLDMFYITSDVYSAAVSGAEGIAAMADCGPMMSTTAYSFTIVELEDPAGIDGIRQRFANNLDWNRWVCVSATNALIAEKDNMVLCLMGGDQLYTLTARAIEAAGWTEIETYKP